MFPKGVDPSAKRLWMMYDEAHLATIRAAALALRFVAVTRPLPQPLTRSPFLAWRGGVQRGHLSGHLPLGTCMLERFATLFPVGWLPITAAVMGVGPVGLPALPALPN